MQRQTYEFIEVSGSGYQLPLHLKQSNPKLPRVPGLLLMSLLAAAVVGPQIAFAILAVASPEVRSALEDQPSVAVELALALAFWIVLVCWPLKNIVSALLCDRQVTIAEGAVEVIDSTPFSKKSWRRPLAAFEGIAHHVRSSLSGVRHEAVLVHAHRNHNIVLMVADQIGEGELRELCRVLSLPRVPAARIYGFPGPSSGAIAPATLNEVAA